MINGIMPNTIITPSRKINNKNNINFKGSCKRINEEDADEFYKAVKISGGLLATSGLIAIACCNKTISKNIAKQIDGFKKAFCGTKTLRKGYSNGPQVYNYGVSQDLQLAWDNLAKNVEYNISTHNAKQLDYNMLYTTESQRLNELEDTAKNIVLRRGGVWN